jgi:hypothetical protein
MNLFNFVDKIYIIKGECKLPTKKNVKREMTPPSLPIFEPAATWFFSADF